MAMRCALHRAIDTHQAMYLHGPDQMKGAALTDDCNYDKHFAAMRFALRASEI